MPTPAAVATRDRRARRVGVEARQEPVERRLERLGRFEERRVPAREGLDRGVREPRDRRTTAAELVDAVAGGPREEHRASHSRRQVADVGVRQAEAPPRLGKDGRDLGRRRHDAAPLLRRGGRGQDDSVVGRERTRVPPRTADAGVEEAHHRSDREPCDPVGPVQPAGVGEHQPPDAARVRRGVPDRARPADRVADEDHALDADRVERLLQQLGVPGGAGRAVVRARAALPWPVERQHPMPRPQVRTQPGEVAGAMADRVQADNGRPGAVVGERQLHPVDRDRAEGRLGARNGTCGRHAHLLMILISPS